MMSMTIGFYPGLRSEPANYYDRYNIWMRMSKDERDEYLSLYPHPNLGRRETRMKPRPGTHTHEQIRLRNLKFKS